MAKATTQFKKGERVSPATEFKKGHVPANKKPCVVLVCKQCIQDFEVNNGISLCHFHHPRKINDEMKLVPTFRELVNQAK